MIYAHLHQKLFYAICTLGGTAREENHSVFPDRKKQLFKKGVLEPEEVQNSVQTDR